MFRVIVDKQAVNFFNIGERYVLKKFLSLRRCSDKDDDDMQFANRPFLSPGLQSLLLALECSIRFILQFKGIRICPKQEGLGDEIQDMSPAAQPALIDIVLSGAGEYLPNKVLKASIVRIGIIDYEIT